MVHFGGMGSPNIYCISDVIYSFVSSYGYNGRHIGQRVAQEWAGRWASQGGPATRTQRRPAPHAQPVASVRQRAGRGPLLPPRGGTTPAHAAMEDHPVGAHGRSNGTIAPSFLVRRCSHGGPLFASSRWPLHIG